MLDFIDGIQRKAYNYVRLSNEVILLKWSKLELLRAEDHTITFDDRISFDASAFSTMNQIRGVHDISVSGMLRYDSSEDRAYADLTISGTMILPCSITNEDVEYDFETTSTEVFAFMKTNDDAHEAKGDVIELLPVIFQLILMEIPLKVVKKDAAYPKGNGWEVMKEADYQKQKRDEIDPRLAKLMEYKAEED